MIDHPLALVALLAAVTALGFWLEERFAWAQRVGASLLTIGFGAVLSNLDLVPVASPVYDAIWGPVTSLAIVWLLFAVDLRDLRLAGPRMLAAFGLAVVGTIIGAICGVLLFGHAFGDNAAKLGGVLTGTYAGGSLNFIAVGRALDLPDSLFAAATAADNLVTALWMGATLLLPLWLAPFFPTRVETAVKKSETDAQSQNRFGDISSRPADILTLIALGLGLSLTADALATHLGWPSVFWLTTLALAVAPLPPVRKLRGAMPLGFLALNLLFVVIGIGSRFAEIAAVGLEILYLTLLVVAIHGLILYGGARLLRLDLATASVASQAAIGGPSTAVALTAARGWPQLALPGMAVGLLGYALGNYAGLAVVRLLVGVVGG